MKIRVTVEIINLLLLLRSKSLIVTFFNENPLEELGVPTTLIQEHPISGYDFKVDLVLPVFL